MRRRRVPPMARRFRPTAAEQTRLNAKAIRNIKSGIELKFHDIASVAVVDLDQVGTMVTLSAVSQGIGDEQRIGDSILCKFADIKTTFKLFTDTDIVRVVLIWDKQNKITGPADVFQIGGADDLRAMMSPFKKDNRAQFLVLHDMTVSLNASAQDENHSRMIHIKKKLNKKIQFQAGTTTPLTGSLKILYVSNRSSAQANKTTYNHYSRLLYSDL